MGILTTIYISYSFLVLILFHICLELTYGNKIREGFSGKNRIFFILIYSINTISYYFITCDVFSYYKLKETKIRSLDYGD